MHDYCVGFDERIGSKHWHMCTHNACDPATHDVVGADDVEVISKSVVSSGSSQVQYGPGDESLRVPTYGGHDQWRAQ